MQKECKNCGAQFVFVDGKWKCPACGVFMEEEISDEVSILLYNASQKLRLCSFSEAEELYQDIAYKYPKSCDAYFGIVLAKHGIKFEKDIDGEFLPTVLSTNIESFSEDRNYKLALEFADEDQKQFYIKTAKKVDEIRLEWLEKAKHEPDYDIFISYKDSDIENNIARTLDSYEAYELYIHLKEAGYKVFYSRESLKDKIGEQRYEPYIFNALQTSNIMICYGTSAEFLNSTWVKNEWSRYYKKMKNGEKEKNSLFVVCDGFSPKDLPSPLSKMQCMDRLNMTFLKDLDNGISKIMKAENAEKEEVEKIIEKAVETSKILNEKASQESSVGDVDLNDIFERKDVAHKVVQTANIDPTLKPIYSLGKDSVDKFDNNTSSRTHFGMLAKSDCPIDEKNKVLTGKSYLKNGMFEDANNAFVGVLQENDKSYDGMIGYMLAQNHCRTLEEFENSGIKNFNDYDFVHKIFECADKDKAERLLLIFCNEVELLLNRKYNDKALEILKFVIQYDADCVEHLEKICFDIAKNRIESVSFLASNIFSILLDNAKNEKAKEVYFDKIVNAYIDCGNFEGAKYFNTKFINFDSTNILAYKANFKIEYKIKTDKEMFEKIANLQLNIVIENFLLKSNKKNAEVLCDELIEYIETSFAKKVYNFSVVSFWTQTILKFDFENRENFILNMIDLSVHKNPKENFVIFDALIDALEKQEIDVHINYLNQYAKLCLNYKNIGLAKVYFEKALDIDKSNSDALFGMLLCNYNCYSEEELPCKLKDFSILNIFVEMLSYAKDDSNKVLIIRKFLNFCINAIQLENANAKFLDKIFMEILKYVPKNCEKQVKNSILNFAKYAKRNRQFEIAIKYYNIALGLDQDSYKAYWGLLQCKLGCCNDQDLVNQNQPLSQFVEFEKAIAAAKDNENVIEHIIDLKAKQQNYNGNRKKYVRKQEYDRNSNASQNVVRPAGNQKRHKNLTKKQRKRKIIKRLFILNLILSIIAVITFGTFAIVTNRNCDPNYTDKELKRMCDFSRSGKGYLLNSIKVNESDTKLTLPSIYKGKEINSLGSCSIYSYKLNSIYIPQNYSYIHEKAFDFCSNINIVEFSENSKLTKIKSRLFADKTNLKVVVLPKNIKKIENCAFENCYNLKYLVIRNEFELSELAFRNANSNVKILYDGTYNDFCAQYDSYYNTKMQMYVKNIYFNNSSTSEFHKKYWYASEDKFENIVTCEEPVYENEFDYYDYDSFYYDSSEKSLEKYKYEIENTTYNYEYYNDGVLIRGLKSPNKQITLPTSIDGYNVYGIKILDNQNVEKIIIPGNYEYFSDKAFSDCTNLQSIIFDKDASLTKITYNMFNGLKKLKLLVLPNSVETIEYYAFENCDSLNYIVIRNDIKNTCNAFLLANRNLKILYDDYFSDNRYIFNNNSHRELRRENIYFKTYQYSINENICKQHKKYWYTYGDSQDFEFIGIKICK